MPRTTVSGSTEEVVLSYRERMCKNILLSRNEEIALAKRVVDGDRKAYDKLIEHNDRLVIKLAYRYWKANRHLCGGLEIHDLIQEGRMGLMKAVEKFDWHKGYKLSTYAEDWIWKYIKEAALSTKSTIYEPIAFQELRAKIHKTSEMLAAQGCPATIRQLAQKLNVKEEVVADVKSVPVVTYTSIDEEVANAETENGDATWHSIIPDVAAIKPETLVAAREALIERSEIVEKVLVTLDALPVPAKHKEAFKAANGLTPRGRMELREIGKKYQVGGKANVSLIIIAIWKKLQAAGVTLNKATLRVCVDQMEAIQAFIQSYEWSQNTA